MAQLYTGALFDPYRWDATASSKPGQYPSLKAFMDDVDLWLKENNIRYKWQGQSTHTNGNRIVYHYNVKIGDERDRILFFLRWGN